MASKLQLKFGTLAGVKTWTFNNVDREVATSKVRSLVNIMIANGSIYKNPPLSAESATIITTIEEPIDLE